MTCVGAFDLPGVAAAASPPVRVWVAAPFGFRLGAWPSACVGAFAQPDAAAAASPPGALRLAVPFRLRLGAWGVASRWPFDPLGAAWISAGICTVLALRFALAAPRIGPAAGPADQALVCRACPALHESFRAAQAFCGFRDSWTGPGCLFCAAHYNIAPKLCQAALLARDKRRISRRRLPLREDGGVKAARQAASVFSHNA